VVVVLTDGEETCGGSPCDLGNKLHAEARQLTVHVIGLRVKGHSWTGGQGILDAQCLARANGGLYLGVETEDELREAFEKTLACPMVTEAVEKVGAQFCKRKFGQSDSSLRKLAEYPSDNI
jgi:Ca-activated chloride channel family protein